MKLPLVQLDQTDGESLAATFDMAYSGDIGDLLMADWRLTLRGAADHSDVLVDLRSGDNPGRCIRVSAPDDIAGRVTFELRAPAAAVAGRGGSDADGNPLLYAGELLAEAYGRADAHARVELALSRANTEPGIWP